MDGGEYNPWATGGLPLLNIAYLCPATKALGPGLRAVVWVQGCCFRCPGCIAPEWIPYRIANLVSPESLAEKLLTNPEVEGFTFSGGEPMLQAAGLATLAQIARKKQDISIICYTGFPLERLQENPPAPGVPDLLSQIDVLIDGPYVDTLNDERGLRGSTNQRIHFLSDRLKGFDFEACPRTVEIHILEGEALLVGVPSKAGLRAFLNFAKQVSSTRHKEDKL
jgi:anaerobic ribonucleoside-triphosphate reductase activating protein